MLGVVFSLLGTAPASFAGSHRALGLSHVGGAHGAWQQIFAVIGLAALMRLATSIIPASPITRAA